MSQLFCLVENDAIVAGPMVRPKAWGRVSGLDLLSENDARAFGWYPFVDDRSGINEKIHDVTFTDVFEINRVVRQYNISSIDRLELKRRKILEIERFAADMRNSITNPISPAEMSLWAKKEEEARNFNASQDPADAPTLSAEATFREVTLQVLVTKVLAKADLFRALESQIAGVCGKHQDTVKSLTSELEIVDYDYSAGWPVLG